MSAFTFFKALEKLANLEAATKKGRIKIPDYFIKLILLNKTKLIKEQLNKKILKELFLNRHLISKNFVQPKIPNFFLANQKYKSLQKINHHLEKEDMKSNSPLPRIDQRRSVLNLRYPEGGQKNNNILEKKRTKMNKDLINIKKKGVTMLNNANNNINNNSNNNSTIKTESVIPNKNVKEIYFITKRFYNNNANNSITNIPSENRKNSINTFYKQKNMNGNDIISTDLNCEKDKDKENNNSENLRMTFVSPLSRSMVAKKFERNNGLEFFLNELSKNNSSNKLNNKYDSNNITSKNYFPKLKININNDTINNNRNIQRISNYKDKKEKISRTYKEKGNFKNININISSAQDNTTINNNNIGELNEIYNINTNNQTEEKEREKEKEKEKKKEKVRSISLNKRNLINIRKQNLKDFQISINMKPIRKFNLNNNLNINLQPSNTRRISKISSQNTTNSKTNQIILIPDFKNKYIQNSDFEKKLNKKLIEFPLYTNISLNTSNDKFYYFINKMYRNQLIEYMQHRINWELITKNNPEDPKTINFAWKYMSNRLNFKNYKYESNKPCKKLKMVNLFERNYEVGNKKNMFINLINYCDQININAFDLVPFTLIINNTKDVDYCLEAISDLMNFVNKYKDINKNIITNKKYNEHFWFDKNFEGLKRQYINIDKNFLSKKNYWILKPTDLYQGKCIEISNSFEEISKKCRNMFKGVEKTFVPELIIKEEDLSDDENNNTNNNNNLNNNNLNYSSKILTTINEENIENKINANITNLNNNNNNINNINNSNKKKAYSKMYCSNEIIIQKYLDHPLLYYKRKFDIRCFVLVDSNLNVFFCKEGHLKASSEFYDLSSTNKLIHITNYSLQKKSAKFEQYEDGNEISYNDFKKFLTEKNLPLEKFSEMLKQMKYLVEISFKSVGKKMLKTNPVLCFEIFGYDFIIDNDFRPWILEINNNPGLCISSPVIQKLVPRMLDDAFRLTIDKVFDTKYSQDVIDEEGKYKTKYKLDGFNDEENVFEFLCNVDN